MEVIDPGQQGGPLTKEVIALLVEWKGFDHTLMQ